MRFYRGRVSTVLLHTHFEILLILLRVWVEIPVRKHGADRSFFMFQQIGRCNPSKRVVMVKALTGVFITIQNPKCIRTLAEPCDLIKAYLCSGCIKGIGPATADAVVAKFGTRTLEILDTDPNQLLMVKGIAQSKLKKIVASYQESRNLRDLTTYMAPFGVSKKKIEKIYEEYGDTSLSVVKSDPFQLCRIKGFGFLTVDAIARKTNAGLKNPLRYAGAIQYTLEEAMNSGHLFLPESELMEKSHQLLNSGFEVEIIAKSEVEDALLRAHSEQMVYNERGRVYLPFERICEVKVAKRVVKMLLVTEPPEVRNVVQEIAQTESKLRQTLSPSQRAAVELCLTNTISIMTGGPGVGKTTTLRALLDIYHRVNPNHEILLAAPTGKASRRMHEQTGYPASTLHSAMGILTENDLEIPNPEFLSADMVVVDECSMVDMKLAYALFERLKPGAQLVLVGDPDQLPSVGAGNVLRELIRSSLVPTAVLNTVFRQASNSRISLNAQAVNNNDTKLLFGDDFVMLDVQDSEQAASLVMKNFLREVQANGIEAVQILSPFRKRGTVCADLQTQPSFLLKAKIQANRTRGGYKPPPLFYIHYEGQPDS